jgi:HSP20 family molecular chaperone IbpA
VSACAARGSAAELLERSGYEELDVELNDCGDVEVTVRVRNRGLRPGKEVVRHEIAVGSSSRDLRLRDSVTFADEPAALAGGER